VAVKANQGINPMEPACGARNRAGSACGNRPLPNGRCRFHGGLSTGPRTANGLARMRAAKMTHGAYGAEANEMRRLFVALKRQSRTITERIG
jgi:hypothetical protein